MEAIATYTDPAIPAILAPTRETFHPLLEKKRAEIEAVPCKTFKYGDTDRHQLDIYYPDPPTIPGGRVPVLVFAYGGGFTNGARRFPPPFDLAYGNVGAFFAKRGIMFVIPDYRLAPNVKYPGPVEDVRDAISWFLANTSTVVAAGGLPTSTALDRIIVMGHSAGGNIVSTLFLEPNILPLDSPVRAATRGLVPQGGALKFPVANDPMPASDILEQYYGSTAAGFEQMPTALLARASDELVEALPDVFVLASEREPPMIQAACDAFVADLSARRGKAVRYEVMKGHNHISPHCALMCGEGEEWAETVAEWVKAKVA